MDLPKLIILDVAHGNCAILQDTEGTVVIDCAHGYTLIDALQQLGISQVDRIIISHADAGLFHSREEGIITGSIRR
jgi:beta-lactamase superfamily II metal-dependent hydrolase